ncbi:hypothetical protein FG386_003193 [Cryptosporidium ryanae]|uniref:uncharacterized protein n=1 Tax=Cryptosporidium ryanae TaxID=515981 RepID=UPI00351A566F|nr:hypothetical protein FG386_003193 [Cryptosporidium ryanae]
MNLIEDIVLFQLGKFTEINIYHWIDSLRVDKNEIKPYRKKSDVVNIARIISITNSLHNTLKSGRKIALRELYYINNWLFKNQSQVVKIVQEFTELLRVQRRVIGLFPSPKGTIGGRVKFVYRDSEILDVEDLGITGATITDLFEALGEDLIAKTDMKYILVVEKASIFQYLMERKIFNRIPCILVTGKGFPDISTRKLVSKLTNHLKIKTIFLGDFDPHGINIYLTYVRGSNNYESQMAACPNIYYLGIHFEDTFVLPIETKLTLTNNDKSVLKVLVEDPIVKVSLDPFFKKT